MRICVLLTLFFGMTFAFGQPLASKGDARWKSLQLKNEKAQNSLLKDIAFRSIGPSIMSGRVDDIEVNPADPTEFYVAYATGGLWHTKNNGQSFMPIFDQKEVIGIGDIAVDWNTRTIWVGTGEVNGSRSSYAGIGVYKSTDNGAHWQYLGLPESHHIGKILLHPSNPEIVWVAALGHLYGPNQERGVFKTTDGGKTWKHTLFVNEHSGAVEMEINPQQPNELYAAIWQKDRKAWNFVEGGKSSGIYKSTDGGESWKLVTAVSSGFPQGDGIGRIGLAVFPKDPSIVYAVVDNYNLRPDSSMTDSARLAAQESPSAKQIFGCEVYKSMDGGNSWKKTHDKPLPTYNTYGYYFGKIFVSHQNPNRIVILGFTADLSNDGGKSFLSMDRGNTHADWHALWINPLREDHMVAGNDGGCNVTYDAGKNWFKANTPALGQYYAIAVDNEKPYHVYGGLQDNGSWYGPSTNMENTDWQDNGMYAFKRLNGGDGMQVQVDPRDHNTVYSGLQFGSYMRINKQSPAVKRLRPTTDKDDRTRFNWQSPILLSKHNPDILYMGGSTLFRSMNKGDDFEKISGDLSNGKRLGDIPYGTLTTISESPFKFGLIYAGTDDGVVSLTKDGGVTWVRLGMPVEKKVKGKTITDLSSALPQGLYISRVLASKHNPARVYATLNGYRDDHFDAYLYVSDDYGATWKRLGTDLPMESVNVVREDPKHANILYIGTDGGAYASMDSGTSFHQFTNGLPFAIPVHDIAVQERENELVLGTHGRSLYIGKLDLLHKQAGK